jgi:hydrogenase maturation protease
VRHKTKNDDDWLNSGHKMTGVLVIGYGSLVRGDDAAGFLAARELQRYFDDDPDVEILPAQQLTPEMAEFIAESSFVLFLDATIEGEPGTIRCTRVEPQGASNGFTHHLSPCSLVASAQQLYGDAAPAMAVTLSGWQFELADGLSAGAKKCLPELVRQAKRVVAKYRKLVDLPTGFYSPVE